MSKWIEILSPDDLPNDDQVCFLTIEHLKDLGRRTIKTSLRSLWAGSRVVAWMPVTGKTPTPFGGERLPIDPEVLKTQVELGQRPDDIAASIGMTPYFFHQVVRRYKPLKDIWTNRYEHNQTDQGVAGSVS